MVDLYAAKKIVQQQNVVQYYSNKDSSINIPYNSRPNHWSDEAA